MKVFDPDVYLNAVVTADMAREVADISDTELCKASFVLYGKVSGGQFLDFTDKQKSGDTHVLLAYNPQPMRKGKR